MISRSRIIAGPGYAKLGSTSFRAIGAIKADAIFDSRVVNDALEGAVNEVVTNRYLKVSLTPEYYDPSVTTALFFPWISMAATPRGTELFTAANSTATIAGNNGDVLELMAACVTKMPSLFLGVEKEVLGDMEITGIGVSGDDFSTNNSLFTVQTAQSYSDPSIPGTSTLGAQKFTAAWGSFAGFTSFQGFKGFEITHELKTKWVTDNGQYIGLLLDSYRCMAKVIASASTMAQMFTAMAMQSTGAAQGQLLSAQSANLVVTGASSMTVTLANAAIKTGGFVFDGVELRQGEIAFVTTNAAATSAALTLA